MQHLLLSEVLLALPAPRSRQLEHLLAIDEEWVAHGTIEGMHEAVVDRERLWLGLFEEVPLSIEQVVGIIGCRPRMIIDPSSDVPLHLGQGIASTDLLQVLVAVTRSGPCAASTPFIWVGGRLRNILKETWCRPSRSKSVSSEVLLHQLIERRLLLDRCGKWRRHLLGGCHLDLLRDHLDLGRNFFALMRLITCDFIIMNIHILRNRMKNIDLFGRCLLLKLRLLHRNVVEVFSR